MFIRSPKEFAVWFKSEVPGAYREIAIQDIKDMTECGLIGRYKYYTRQDLETVRAILQYEQLLNNLKQREVGCESIVMIVNLLGYGTETASGNAKDR